MISIVVPVYNGQDFIRRSLNKILAQTFKDWELIVVDDGSTDKTAEILSEYEKNTQVRIIKKENGGVSSARNVGIEYAQGEYITFIDADDIIDPTYLESLSKGIGYDMVVTGFCYGEIPQKPSFSQLDAITKDKIAINLAEYLSSDYFCYPWARMFKLDIIKKKKLKFNTKLRFGEDHLFNWEFLEHIESLILEVSTLYHKISEEGSGIGYSHLSFAEIDFLDKKLYQQKKALERAYGVNLSVPPKTLFHISFMKDYVKEFPSSFYMSYFRQYHPEATETEAYKCVAEFLFHPALHGIKRGKISLADLDTFIDKPLKLFLSTKMKSRIIIPFLKMHADYITKVLIERMR